MSGWSKQTLKDLASSVTYGYTASASTEKIGPHFLRITDIVHPQIDWDSVPYCAADSKTFEKYRLRKGDIVVARTGATIGFAKLIRDDVESVYASYLVNIRIDENKADPYYVGCVVESNAYRDYVLAHANGSAQPNASAPVLAGFSLPLPPLSEQRRIVGILSAYDDLIENNRKRIALLEESARQLYKEWFVRLRFPGHERVPVEDGVPKGWKRMTIQDVCETIGGGTPSTKNPTFWNGDIPWVVPTDVTRENSLVLLKTERCITHKGLAESAAKMLPANTILMTSRASVGYFAIADFPVCTNQGFINIIPHDEVFRHYLLFNLESRKSEIRSNAKGTTFPEISKSTFRAMPIIVPSRQNLSLFDKWVDPIIRLVIALRRESETLAVVKTNLLGKLMGNR